MKVEVSQVELRQHVFLGLCLVAALAIAFVVPPGASCRQQSAPAAQTMTAHRDPQFRRRARNRRLHSGQVAIEFRRQVHVQLVVDGWRGGGCRGHGVEQLVVLFGLLELLAGNARLRGRGELGFHRLPVDRVGQRVLERGVIRDVHRLDIRDLDRRAGADGDRRRGFRRTIRRPPKRARR